MENVVTVVFDVESEAYQALSELKRESVTYGYTISQMGLVKKQNDRIVLLEGFDSGRDTTDDTAKGGLIGSLIGILGGPLGFFLGGSVGLLVGSVKDTADSVKNVSMLEQVSAKLSDGQVILAALIQEADEVAFNSRIGKFGTTIIRFDAAVIAEEIEEASKLQKEMERETKRKLREEKSQKRKQAIAEKRKKIQADFEAFKQKVSQK